MSTNVKLPVPFGIVGVAFSLFSLCHFVPLICIYLLFLLKHSCLFREVLQILGWRNSHFLPLEQPCVASSPYVINFLHGFGCLK
ncbi:hypothetical protein LSH36_1623g00006, partial [Paralvinella palmiformis]